MLISIVGEWKEGRKEECRRGEGESAGGGKVSWLEKKESGRKKECRGREGI